MRKEYESELAKRISEKKGYSRTWAIVALVAAVVVAGAAAVTVVAAGNGDVAMDHDREMLQDGSCDDGDGICDNDLDGDGVCDNDCTCDSDGDGICDNDLDGDGICDTCEECTCPCA